MFSHLHIVVPALLESLSGLEDSRLNYVEQHAERLGLDAGKLESARVSAAQGGILGETLETCARHVDSETFTALAPVQRNAVLLYAGRTLPPMRC